MFHQLGETDNDAEVTLRGPLLGDAIMAEASRLHTIYQLLEMTADHGVRPAPIALGDNSQPTMSLDADALLSRVHCNLESINTRLECAAWSVLHDISQNANGVKYNLSGMRHRWASRGTRGPQPVVTPAHDVVPR